MRFLLRLKQRLRGLRLRLKQLSRGIHLAPGTGRGPVPAATGHYGLRTDSVRGCMARTRWADSGCIEALMAIEEMEDRDLRKALPGGAIARQHFDIQRRRLRECYPVETEAIRLELREGVEITPEVLRGIEEMVRREEEVAKARIRQMNFLMRERAEAECARHQQELMRRRQEWQRKGGRP